MAVSPYVERLRALVGTEVLLLPSVTVLPKDAEGRVLLVRSRESGEWMTIGGMIELDEDPADAARREAHEEAGVVVELGPIIGASGGPQFRLEYANGDRAAYVTIVYEAIVVDGSPAPDHEETSEVGWFGSDDFAHIGLGPFARAQFRALGWW
jgi:8-oxo-dGTP pyrophosphatase MutT (NUDIX family)